MRRWPERILAILFSALVIFMCAAALIPNARDLAYSVTTRYRAYGSGLRARITAFEETLNGSLFGKDAFQQANASMQYAIGKRMLSFGDGATVTLAGGQLYELRPDDKLSGTLDEIVLLSDYCKEKGIPMAFVYAHTSLYEDGLLPVGAVDYNGAAADQALAQLRAAGVVALDSREFLSGYPLERLIYRTDFHWTVFAASRAARAAAEWLEGEGVEVNPGALLEERFREEVYKGVFLGRLGQRVGPKNAPPEDFALLFPEGETYIEVTHREGDESETRAGPFEESVMRAGEAMARGEAGYSTLCYLAYGPHAWDSAYQNPSAGEGRVMVFKDSYGTPVAAFLSLAAGNVLAADPRKTQTSAEEYIERFAPDAVLVVYCQDMLREKSYAFME